MARTGRKPRHLGLWLLAVIGIGGFVGYLYWAGREFLRTSGYSALGAHGWTAMILGLLGTAALAGVLMWLMFFSARKGFDDRAGGEDDGA